VREYVENDDLEALELLVEAYLSLTPEPQDQLAIREYLDRHRTKMDEEDLLRLAVRFSIERRDTFASTFAHGALEAGIRPTRTPVAAIVLWISGERRAAAQAVSLFERDEFGWWDQAAESLALFITVSSAAPERQVDLLRGGVNDATLRRPATVGAMVARLAFLRMRAFSARGDWEEAVSEARAVITTNGYRDYDLHMQRRDSEFDVRLLDRLAVTPDEVLEAKALIETYPELEATRWLLHEGKLIRTAG
jgi:hypothetical protein